MEILFGIYPNNGFAQFAYFGPEFRTPIMKAGREQTLLKIRYKGADRIVEPYSLVFTTKRRHGARIFRVFNKRAETISPALMFYRRKIESIKIPTKNLPHNFRLSYQQVKLQKTRNYLIQTDRHQPRAPENIWYSKNAKAFIVRAKIYLSMKLLRRKFTKSKHDVV